LRLVQPISFNFLNNLPNSYSESSNTNSIQLKTQVINGDKRSIIFQHPSSRIRYPIMLPLNAFLSFGIGMDPAVWSSEKGDGMLFKVFVQKTDEPNILYQIFQKYIDPKNNIDDRRWYDYKLDLTEYGGQKIDIIFETLPGPSSDFNFDWGGWSMPVLITKE
jgi:hypothetical protein